MKRKGAGYYLLPSLLLILGSVYAVGPDWYVESPPSKLVLRQECSLPAGQFTGEGIHVRMSSSYMENPSSQMQVTVSPGAVLEDVTLEVSHGGVLSLRNCTLRKVALKGAVRSTITLQNCTLENCYVAPDNGQYRRADGTSFTQAEAYKQIGGPKISLTDCMVANSMLASPHTCGVTAWRCTFVSCMIAADAEDAQQTEPSYVLCAFNASKLSSTYALLNTVRCRFNECVCPDVLSPEAGSQLTKPAVAQLTWEKGTPELPPATTNGNVRFELIAAAEEAGSSQTQWDGVSDLPGTGTGKPQALKEVWKLEDFDSYLAKRQNPPQSSDPPAATAASRNNQPIFGARAAEGVTFQSRINQVNGLLISQLSSGGEAGQVTRMSLTALPSRGDFASSLKFNQDVGESMGKALKEVSKFSQLRHGGWPMGHEMEIGFEDKYIGKDGPSAAVACALLLEAAITGKKWDPAFAVTGDMNADGSVQPIGGVQAKIRGATKGSCKLVGVPVKNEKAVMDILVLEGPAPLVGITVFGIKTFEDALLLASTERPVALQNALTDFDNMRGVMMRDPRQIVPLLRTPHAAQRLQALLAAAPNCYSAKYLLLYTQGRAPRTLSIGGSIETAQSSADSLVSAIDHDLDTNLSSLKNDELGTSLNKLRTLRPVLDPRVWPYLDNLVAYGEVVRGSLLNPVRSGARYIDLVGKANKAASGAKAAYDKLINDVQVREELGL